MVQKNLNIKPKIAILGLNPHNAEFRKNSEEVKNYFTGHIET